MRLCQVKHDLIRPLSVGELLQVLCKLPFGEIIQPVLKRCFRDAVKSLLIRRHPCDPVHRATNKQ